MGGCSLANAVAGVHLAFVVFVVLGGLLALRWPRLAWIHLPAAAWGVLIACTDVVCPLTPLEKALRAREGGSGYAGGFIRHYLLPEGLPEAGEITLFVLAVALNAWAYWRVARWPRHRSSPAPAAAARPRTG